MNNIFCVIKKSGVFTNDEISDNDLWSLSLFKTLSLLLSKRAGLPIPSTVLLLDNSRKNTDLATNILGLPIMLRMDYSILHKRKLLGGISIASVASLHHACVFLRSHNFYPVLQTNIERITDLYSVGIMLDHANPNLMMEVVGAGFDASDLRLGATLPHESIIFDMHSGKIAWRTIISSQKYSILRRRRAQIIAARARYTSLVNREGYLLPSLWKLKPNPEEVKLHLQSIPKTYVPMDKESLEQAISLAEQVKRHVAPSLPRAEALVVSMSLTQKHGWVLWDIFGEWYQR